MPPPEPKRRRLNGKFQPEQLFVPVGDTPSHDSSLSRSAHDADPEEQLPKIRQLLQLAEQCAPRVGKSVIRDGPVFEGVQQLYPDKHIVVLDVCRGINRMRVCPLGDKGLAPFRRSFGKRRNDLEAFQDAAWEAWEDLSHRQQIRAGTPSKLLLTVFATNKRGSDDQPDSLSKRSKIVEGDKVDDGVDKGPIDEESQNKMPSSLEEGKGNLTCKTHGPLFTALP